MSGRHHTHQIPRLYTAAFLSLGIQLALLPWIAVAQQPAHKSAPKKTAVGHLLDSVPEGFRLHAYDDCGIATRQPHVDTQDSYCWTFNTSDTDVDLKSRSAAFSYKAIHVRYTDLDPALSYVLALTYASDHVYKRVQSLWANGVELHGPYALPKAKAVRLIVEVPRSVTKSGKMALELRIHGEVNATVSIVELWANAPAKHDALRLHGVSGVFADLAGQVLDLAYEPVAGAAVRLSRPGQTEPLATTESQADGWFRFPRSTFAGRGPKTDLEIIADKEGRHATHRVPASELTFSPVRYRPLPSGVAGLDYHRRSLGGTWQIDPAPDETARARPLDDPRWKEFQVPGQWRQQGFDVPQDQPVAVAREFDVPAKWSGYRIFLRFDAIHAGTHYWVNGAALGYSENLFTPVEWEITSLVRPAERNRLDLQMKVDTVSERLSYSSAYAFHNLGGIDRAVSIYALPPVHVRDMHLSTHLDKAYRDANLKLSLTLENPGQAAVSGLSLGISLAAPDGNSTPHSVPRVALDTLEPGTTAVDVATHVGDPLKWSAEKPNLYHLVLEFRRGGELVERIERWVGFRQIEIRDAAMFINGVPVKLAGACRHEIDPLTGRANTMRHAEQDVKLLKAANLNYLRTSHYPPTIELVEAADQYGTYLEVEAPFCWVGVEEDLTRLREVLVPTSAMIDYYHSHPSVVLWSLANESHFNRSFEISHEMVKQLDPTRPTTFNNPDPKRICDIANLHYPPMPYDELVRDDPRPLLLGEYYFPVCHEQTDVRINPGLREFFGFGHSEPESPWGRHCAESFTKPFLKPCTPPGAWSHIVRSRRVVGGAIFAALDEPFYFADGTHAGYAWHHGFWGILDAWRRPKPEWWLAKHVFSPVWFPAREVEYTPGQGPIRLPVENRYSFTDLSELAFTWQVGQAKGEVKVRVPPRSQGEIEIPVPRQAAIGDRLLLTIMDAREEVVDVVAIQLGPKERPPLPRPGAGAPKSREEGNTVFIEGDGLSLVFDKAAGDFSAADPRHRASILRFPVPHVTRYDFGDLAGPHGKPYAVFPDTKTRAIDEVVVASRSEGIELRVRDHYNRFAGTMRWLIDKHGMSKVAYRYRYSGEVMDTREAGVRFVLRPECNEVRWRRWSEWGVFPPDSISRTEGRAKALRTGTREADPEGVRPTWPWSQDQTELGTADFRSIKFNVYEAALMAEDGSGIRVHADADLHVRPCLADGAALLHVLSRCELGQVVMNRGDELAGSFVVDLVPRGR